MRILFNTNSFIIYWCFFIDFLSLNATFTLLIGPTNFYNFFINLRAKQINYLHWILHTYTITTNLHLTETHTSFTNNTHVQYKHACHVNCQFKLSSIAKWNKQCETKMWVASFIINCAPPAGGYDRQPWRAQHPSESIDSLFYYYRPSLSNITNRHQSIFV